MRKFYFCKEIRRERERIIGIFQGGVIELGEDEKGALVRECQEELNVKIKITGKGGKWKFFRDADNQWVAVQNYEAEIVEGEIKLSDEHVDYKWVDEKNVKEYPVKDESLFAIL